MRLILAILVGLIGAPVASAEVPRVVTDIAPVHALVAQVMGDLGAPVLLMEQGADAHSFQLRPSQASAVAGAGLVVWVGPEMTPWLDRALEGIAAEVPRLGLLGVPGTRVRELEEGSATLDPHGWLDPQNGVVWLESIAGELARIDPGNAGVYRANTAAAVAELAVLEAEIEALLGPVRDRPFVVFHEAYGYFTERYGLTVAGSIATGDAAAPGAARLVALRAAMQAGGVVCIFPEAAQDSALVEQMAAGVGVRIGGALDPEGVALQPGPGLYRALLRGLAVTLAECLADP